MNAFTTTSLGPHFSNWMDTKVSGDLQNSLIYPAMKLGVIFLTCQGVSFFESFILKKIKTNKIAIFIQKI